MTKKRMIVSYGGGTNSTAMLMGLYERKQRPDAIIFSDTGGEKPETYAYLDEMNTWLTLADFPPIEILRGEYWTPKMRTDGSLEGQCLRLGVLPSKAYGMGACSLKWKVEPADKWLRKYMEQEGITRYQDITRLIGFDAGEPSRVIRARTRQEERHKKGDAVVEEYPLFDWGWTRPDCLAAIARAGLSAPGKSACFFCPSAKKHEIHDLAKENPDLMARALEIERKAFSGEGEGKHVPNGKVIGLGRHFTWKEVLENPDRPDPFESRYCEPSCDTCFDGD